MESNFGKVEANLDSLDAQIDKILQVAPSAVERIHAEVVPGVEKETVPRPKEK